MSKPIIMFSVRVPRSLHREFKKKCIDNDVRMSEVIIAVMKRFVRDEEFREEIVDMVRGNRGVSMDGMDPDREAQEVIMEVFGQ